MLTEHIKVQINSCHNVCFTNFNLSIYNLFKALTFNSSVKAYPKLPTHAPTTPIFFDNIKINISENIPAIIITFVVKLSCLTANRVKYPMALKEYAE